MDNIYEDMLRVELARSVTVHQLAILRALDSRSGCRVRLLADLLGVRAQAIHNLVYALAARGFVELRRPLLTVHIKYRGRVVVRLLRDGAHNG